MKRYRYLILTLLCAQLAMAQTNVTSNSKPLAFMNPALQQVDYEKGIISASYQINPMSESSNFSNYIFLTEFKLNESIRLGVHSSTIDTRLNKLDVHKLYGAYQFNFEEGGYLSIGLEAGLHKDMTKLAEFNKVLTPTVYQFEDSVSQAVDLGIGVAFHSDNFYLGLGLNKLNSPLIVDHPFQRWGISAADSTVIEKKDTTIVWNDGDFIPSKLQSSINMIYRWEAGNVKIMHSLQLSNVDLEGYGFIGLQNFLTFGDKLHLGLGLYENGELSYIGSLGYSILPNMRVEVASFIHEEFEYDATAAYPEIEVPKGYTLDAQGNYVSSGYKATLEFSLQYSF